MVGGAVVAAAEECEVGEVGGACVGPVFDVVGVAPAVGSLASGALAVLVACVEGAAGCGWDGAGGSSDVEYL